MDNCLLILWVHFPSGSPNVVEIIFANDTKAYAVTCASRGQLIVFNPSTMSVTKEIDLSPYAEGDKDPDGGNGIVRDGKLFLLSTKQSL